MTSHKAQLGQFMTTNSKYIFQGMTLPELKNQKYIEPFAGNGDLVEFLILQKVSREHIDCYDIEPKHAYIQKRDSLLDPIDYTDAYVITNPPYLARNKAKDKTIFDRYRVNDLYKCFIQQLISKPPIGGMLIIPLNFWSSIREMDIQLRKEFLKIFRIEHLNIFEERVFEDTSYTTCAFQFSRGGSTESLVRATLIPSNILLEYVLQDQNHFTFGGEIYNLSVDTDIKITRLTRLNREEMKDFTTGIVVKCIDDGKEESQWIRLFYTEESSILEKHTDSTKDLSFRSYAVLVIQPELNKTQQQILVERFNSFLNEKRKNSGSLFLANYRDKYRKRISFELVYRIVGYLLSNEISK